MKPSLRPSPGGQTKKFVVCDLRFKSRQMDCISYRVMLDVDIFGKGIVVVGGSLNRQSIMWRKKIQIYQGKPPCQSWQVATKVCNVAF